MKATLECCLRPLKKHSQQSQEGAHPGSINKGSGFSGAQQRERQSKTRMEGKVGDGIAETISKIYEEKCPDIIRDTQGSGDIPEQSSSVSGGCVCLPALHRMTANRRPGGFFFFPDSWLIIFHPFSDLPLVLSATSVLSRRAHLISPTCLLIQTTSPEQPSCP